MIERGDWEELGFLMVGVAAFTAIMIAAVWALGSIAHQLGVLHGT